MTKRSALEVPDSGMVVEKEVGVDVEDVTRVTGMVVATKCPGSCSSSVARGGRPGRAYLPRRGVIISIAAGVAAAELRREVCMLAAERASFRESSSTSAADKGKDEYAGRYCGDRGFGLGARLILAARGASESTADEASDDVDEVDLSSGGEQKSKLSGLEPKFSRVNASATAALEEAAPLDVRPSIR